MAVSYRQAIIDDAEEISNLVLNSQRQFCFHEYSPEGQQLMLRVCGVLAIKQYLARGDVYFVALSNGTVIGVARRFRV